VAVIAELKRRSPSKGAINPRISAGRQASLYERGGASALSILTESARFGGSSEDLTAARDAVRLPLLKKDFHVDPVQLLEAKSLGASAALLIARALSPAELDTMAIAAADLGLEILVEVRDEQELERALGVNARVIGVNNRNLETLEIDVETGTRLLPLVPGDRIAVAESGVRGVDDVRRAAASGADAVLVGSSLSAATDPTAAVRALTGVERVARGP
jgi:indole-3-glycerol phosphate synthase